MLVLLGLVLASDSTRYVSGEKPISFCESIKEEPIEIELNGAAEINVVVGHQYTEAGAVSNDGCENVDVEISGEVNTNVVGDYTVSYNVTSESGRTGSASRRVHVIEPRGVIYLTFDDGPGIYTDWLLDILAKYGVKATFFVTCGGDDATILREYNEGHTVALHTCSHDYSYVYSSVANYYDDLYAVQNRVKSITGQTINLIRFPGGSSNMVSRLYDGGAGIMSYLVNDVAAKGFVYFDWNVSSGDANTGSDTYSVYENVIYGLKDGDSVVLQHDIKDFSVEAVENIIIYGLNNGYVFDKLNANSFTAHHGVNN